MTDRSLLIVRGGRREDSTFSCLAHTPEPNQYAAIEFEDGLVKNRTIYKGSERGALERLAKTGAYTTVFADKRKDSNLIPFSYPKHAVQADLNVFRRAKSDAEIQRLTTMASILSASVNVDPSISRFRGVVDDLNYRHAMTSVPGEHFTLKRYGIKDDSGLEVELTSVEPHTRDWEERMLRIQRGCDAVRSQLGEGASIDGLDKAFRSELDPQKDRMYGRVLHHSGYDAWEAGIELNTLRMHDVVTISPVVGDTEGRWAPIMHSVHPIRENEFRAASSQQQEDFKNLLYEDTVSQENKDLISIVGDIGPTKVTNMVEEVMDDDSTSAAFSEMEAREKLGKNDKRFLFSQYPFPPIKTVKKVAYFERGMLHFDEPFATKWMDGFQWEDAWYDEFQDTDCDVLFTGFVYDASKTMYVCDIFLKENKKKIPNMGGQRTLTLENETKVCTFSALIMLEANLYHTEMSLKSDLPPLSPPPIVEIPEGVGGSQPNLPFFEQHKKYDEVEVSTNLELPAFHPVITVQTKNENGQKYPTAWKRGNVLPESIPRQLSKAEVTNYIETVFQLYYHKGSVEDEQDKTNKFLSIGWDYVVYMIRLSEKQQNEEGADMFRKFRSLVAQVYKMLNITPRTTAQAKIYQPRNEVEVSSSTSTLQGQEKVTLQRQVDEERIKRKKLERQVLERSGWLSQWGEGALAEMRKRLNS